MTTPSGTTPPTARKRARNALRASNRHPEPDGPLTLARDALNDAITALTHPQPTLHNHQIVYLDSRYQQLRQSIDISGTRSGSGGTGSGPTPCWMDALKLVITIDKQTAQWDNMPTTPQRLTKVAAHPWRPQDCEHMNTVTAEIRKWITAIDDLFAPKPLTIYDRHRPGVWASCPICGHNDAYKLSDEAHRVRVPALVVTIEEGLCQRCHTAWPPGLLCRLIGYGPPQEISA